MIKKIKIKNFKKFRDITIEFNPNKNILIGENGTGKSSILQAINIVLSGSYSYIEKIGFKSLFNVEAINEFFKEKNKIDKSLENIKEILPEVIIELYFNELEFENEYELNGKLNTEKKEETGLQMKISPDLENIKLIKNLIENTEVFPFEYYKLEFNTFAGRSYNSYKKFHKFKQEFIDTSLINTNYEIQKHITNTYKKSIKEENRKKINNEFRNITTKFMSKMRENNIIEDKTNFKIEIDLKNQDSFKDKLTVQKKGVDVNYIGHGEKVLLSMENISENYDENIKILIIEEPENHLSFLNMLKLIEALNVVNYQIFISTHSNMISSRLGLNECILISENSSIEFKKLNKETVKFFQKAPNENILNFILSKKSILVEGAAEYILMNKFFELEEKILSYNKDIHICSVGGLSFKNYLEIAIYLNNKVAVITDNDKNIENNIIKKYNQFDSNKNISVFYDKDEEKYTFEVSLYKENKSWLENNKITTSKDILKYMLNNKAETALRILEKLEIDSHNFKIPNYIEGAIKWIVE